MSVVYVACMSRIGSVYSGVCVAYIVACVWAYTEEEARDSEEVARWWLVCGRVCSVCMAYILGRLL